MLHQMISLHGCRRGAYMAIYLSGPLQETRSSMIYGYHLWLLYDQFSLCISWFIARFRTAIKHLFQNLILSLQVRCSDDGKLHGIKITYYNDCGCNVNDQSIYPVMWGDNHRYLFYLAFPGWIYSTSSTKYITRDIQ